VTHFVLRLSGCGVPVSALCVPPRLFAPSITPSFFSNELFYCFTPAATYRSAISSQSTWPAVEQSQTSRIIGGNLQNQRIQVKCSGFVLQLSELIICRKAAPRRQETANPSQKPTSASNTTVSQAVLIQKPSYPGSAGTSIPSSKQYPRE
jgi:hypothetical protein